MVYGKSSIAWLPAKNVLALNLVITAWDRVDIPVLPRNFRVPVG